MFDLFENLISVKTVSTDVELEIGYWCAAVFLLVSATYKNSIAAITPI